MGGISDEHVEWAVVNRLKAMLDAPPKTKFNVTQTFSLFTTIVLWSKNRAWVGGRRDRLRPLNDRTDLDAHHVRERLAHQSITAEPWSLSRQEPLLADNRAVGGVQPDPAAAAVINGDFEGMAAEDFFKWLRDALAHGDGRTIRPIHRPGRRAHKTWLAGFWVEFEKERGASRKLTLSLYEADMERLGGQLADLFCRSLSNDDEYFLRELGTANIDEVRRVA